MQTFADFMEQVLYGPAGYYSTGAAQSGKAGDYFTSPDVGKVFGGLLSMIFWDWKEKLGKADFCLVEAGAGEGRLAGDILETRPFRYIAVEKSPARRAELERFKQHNPAFEVRAGLQELGPFHGVLFGNELLDAFPVHRVRFHEGKLQELYSEIDGKRRKSLWKEPSTARLESYFQRLGISLPEGYETEVNLGMRDWLQEASRVLASGLVVLIDYGRPAHEYYHPERTRGTLRAFSRHHVSADFLSASGETDLTADVDFTSLALDAREAGLEPLAFMEMGTFLMAGIREEKRETREERREKREERRQGPREAEAAKPERNFENFSTLISHRASLKYLLHPEGLGAAFHVLILGKNIDPAAWRFAHNRLARLGLPAA